MAKEELDSLRAPDSPDWPWVLEFSGDWENFDKSAFTRTWYVQASFLAQKSSIPVPLRVRLEPKEDIVPTVVRLKGPGGFERKVPIPSFPKKDIFIIPAGPP